MKSMQWQIISAVIKWHCVCRLNALAPGCRRVGLSATVAWPEALAAWLAPGADPDKVRRIEGGGGAEGRVSILTTKAEMPWSGIPAFMHWPKSMKRSKKRRQPSYSSIRAVCRKSFSRIWRLNTENLPIALHHGSLAGKPT